MAGIFIQERRNTGKLAYFCLVIIIKSDLLLLNSKKRRLVDSKIAIFCHQIIPEK